MVKRQGPRPIRSLARRSAALQGFGGEALLRGTGGAAEPAHATVRAVLAHRSRKALAARGPTDGERPAPAPARRRLVERAVARLPEMYRHVLVLAEVEGLSLAATARLLGLRVAVTRSRLHRARVLVNDALKVSQEAGWPLAAVGHLRRPCP